MHFWLQHKKTAHMLPSTVHCQALFNRMFSHALFNRMFSHAWFSRAFARCFCHQKIGELM